MPIKSVLTVFLIEEPVVQGVEIIQFGNYIFNIKISLDKEGKFKDRKFFGHFAFYFFIAVILLGIVQIKIVASKVLKLE